MSIATAAKQIIVDRMEVVVAGGVESISLVQTAELRTGIDDELVARTLAFRCPCADSGARIDKADQRFKSLRREGAGEGEYVRNRRAWAAGVSGVGATVPHFGPTLYLPSRSWRNACRTPEISFCCSHVPTREGL